MKRKLAQLHKTGSGKLFKSNKYRGIGTGAAVSAISQLLDAYGKSATTTTSKRKRGSRGIQYVGRRRKFRKRKLRYIARKPKINKKFRKNFQKCQAWTKCFGKYIYQGNCHVRQQNLDEYTVVYTDQEGQQLRMGGPTDILDAVSICFNGKAATPNQYALGNNLPDDAKYTILSQNIAFEFRSTSSHVLDIELYECTFKKAMINQNIDTLITQGIASANVELRELDGSGLPVSGSYTLNAVASKLEDIPDLWKYVHVKVHKIKLNPGDMAKKYLRVQGMKTYDLGQCQSNNTLDYNTKGTKQFFFRVINAISVSGDVGGNAKVHAFPSNDIGGCAVRYYKTYRIQQPDNATTTENRIVLGTWNHTTETTDQQVCFQNPISTTTVG